jgi:Ca-activated chloride channel homolog
MNSKIILSLAALLFFASCDQFNSFLMEPKVIYLNKLAQAKLKNEKETPPQEEILEALELAPEKPQLHSNLGIAFSRIKKNPESEKSFTESLRLALSQKKPEAQFVAQFNLGVFYGAQGKISEALEHYQAALDLAPSSVEVKHNIELLWQSQQNQDGKGDSKDQNQNGKDDKDQENKDGQDDQKKKDDQENKDGQDRKQTPKYKPRQFKAGDLSEADAKKMLEELGRQDKRIRSQFNNRQNKNSKEESNEKDW